MDLGTSDLSRVFAALLDGGELELPPVPDTAAQVLDLCQQETTDAAKLSSVVHRDQALASNVLRVANSAAYAGQVPCASLQQAVSRLGLQLVTEIAVAVAVRGRLFANGPFSSLLGELWQHSVLVGFYTKEIARMRRRNVEVAFLCGLLHDVGKAVLLNGLARESGSASPIVAGAAMREALHEHHVAAGLRLAQQWQLPEQVAEAVACHHEPSEAKRFADMAMSVCLANGIAHHLAPLSDETPLSEDALRGHDVLVGLNIYRDELDALLAMHGRATMVVEGMR